MNTRIEDLPSLALDLICEYLTACETRRRSLFAFSLASKRCCAAATAQRFKTIHLRVEGNQQLKQNLDRWKDLVEVKGQNRYVRQMRITGCMNPEGHKGLFMDGSLVQDDSFPESLDRDEDTISRPRSLSMFIGSEPVINASLKESRDLPWLPLKDFLSKCLGLKDLIWESTD
jgi:hypothetical protein